MFKLTDTVRGFPILLFDDCYDKECSIQMSSVATYDAVWLGINHAEPKILASRAEALGISTDETTGWISYPIPVDVSLNTRMHLTRDQAGALARVLQHYYETGELNEIP